MRIALVPALAAVFAFVPFAVSAQSVTLSPIGDVWFYKNVPTSRDDPYMLAWGNGTSDLDSTFPPGDFFAYDYLKFDLGGAFNTALSYTVTSATLTVYQFANAGYTKDDGTATPLLARALGDNWDESTYTFGAGNPQPGALLGQGDMSNYTQTDNFAIPVNLLGSQVDLDALFNAAVHGSGRINLAMTSKMNPGGPTGTQYYMLWTKEGAPAYVEQLHLDAKVVPEPGSLVGFASGALMLWAYRRKAKG